VTNDFNCVGVLINTSVQLVYLIHKQSANISEMM